MATTICLNMIVKNESKIITRLFDSILPLIDTFCICDTGSTDNTIDIIKQYFTKKDISGTIFNEPFKNFGYNRTVALKAAKNMATYILLLDADMKIIIDPTFDKQSLTADIYTIIQGNNDFQYANTRLVRGNIDITCVGPTHEYYDHPDTCTKGHISKVFIHDIGDGGCKDNKFTRDIQLLKEGLEEEPANGRYMFYLANSYYNTNQNKKALEIYKKRIEVGGWVEEVWYSYYRLGLTYMRLGDHEKAITSWLEGYNYYPKRAENIYELIKHFRITSKHNLAYLFYSIAKKIKLPADNVLFLHKDVYNYLLDYELTIIAYYVNPKPDVIPIFSKLFNLSTNLNTQHLLTNYKFYCPEIVPETKKDLNIFHIDKNYISSSPSIIEYKNNYIINVRHVDYKLSKNGDYTYHDGWSVNTRNAGALLDSSFNIIQKTIFNADYDMSCRIRGIEDLKIISHNNKIFYIGTTQVKKDNKEKLCMKYGIYDLQKKSLSGMFVESPENAECEKNWALFNGKENVSFIYKWHPFQVGEFRGKKIVMTIQDDYVPPVFKMLRGSSNGYHTGSEIWFVCHTVEYSKPRHYYHCIVVLDAETLKYKKHSTFFTFEGKKIEFCLGIIVKEDKVLMTHSCWDSTSQLYIYDKEKLEQIFL